MIIGPANSRSKNNLLKLTSNKHHLVVLRVLFHFIITLFVNNFTFSAFSGGEDQLAPVPVWAAPGRPEAGV